MPFYKRKRVVRRKRNVRRRPRMMRRVPRPFGRSFNVSRTVLLGTLTSNATLDTFAAYSFNLALLPNYTEFTVLFDEYRINKVAITFFPTGIKYCTSSALTVPPLHIVVDKDDDTTPTTIDQLFQYPGVRTYSGDRRVKYVFRPRFSAAIYNGVTTAYGSRTGWLDCNSTGVPHYGLKLAYGPSTSANAFKYNIYCRFYLSFRGVR